MCLLVTFCYFSCVRINDDDDDDHLCQVMCTVATHMYITLQTVQRHCQLFERYCRSCSCVTSICRPTCCISVTLLLNICGESESNYQTLDNCRMLYATLAGVCSWPLHLTGCFNDAVWWLVSVCLAIYELLNEVASQPCTVMLIANCWTMIYKCESLPTMCLDRVMQSIVWFEEELSRYRCNVIWH